MTGQQESEAVQGLYEILGVSADASREEIHAAFKKLAKTHHPDVAGGENEAFNAIRQAYDVLSDAAQRQAYDEFGVVPGVEESSHLFQANQDLGALMTSILSEIEPEQLERIDLIGMMRGLVTKSLSEARRQLELLETKRRKAARNRAVIEKRLSKKANHRQNVLLAAAQAMESQLAGNLAALNRGLKVGEAMLELLADYTYSSDVQKMLQTRSFTAASHTGWSSSW